jgi:predicted nucleic acid-binding protein
MAAVLVDTNVLVYAYDRGEFQKQEQAIQVLDGLHRASAGCLSVQSLGEFFRATTRKKSPILTVAKAREQLALLSAAWPVLEVTAQVALEAARGVETHQLSYWDAQLWAAARLNQVPVIFSEDFAPGAYLEGVRFVNPFAPQFDLAPWAE